MPTCLAFQVVVFYCFMSFMKTSIVFEGLSIILYLFWYLQMWVLNQAAADLVLIMYLTNSIPEWHIIWIFVYLRRHMFWGPLVYLFRVVSFVYITFKNASIVFVWLHINLLFCFEILLNQKLKIWHGIGVDWNGGYETLKEKNELIFMGFLYLFLIDILLWISVCHLFSYMI